MRFRPPKIPPFLPTVSSEQDFIHIKPRFKMGNPGKHVQYFQSPLYIWGNLQILPVFFEID
ncbi:hypothetical protein ES332_D08G166800v1 [Gossypium tomentosum]|nr:hypothetical protein ES332_D08G166800v1 [Gossypium tomentosum]